MELPEDALLEQHGFDSKGETYGMLLLPRLLTAY